MPERVPSSTSHTEMSLTEFRSLTRDDEPILRSWLTDYLQEHRRWWSIAYGRKPESTLESLVEHEWERLLEASSSPTNFVRVAGASAPTGVVFARVQPEPFMGFQVGVLSWIYVDPSSRQRGIAGSLLEAAHAWMEDQGARGRQVYVTIENDSAVALYRRHGYATVDYRMLGQ